MNGEQLINQAQADLKQLKQQISLVVVGQEEVIDNVLIALISGGHALIEGVPGLGKTLLVRSLAKAIRGKFGRVQFTPDLMPSDVSGYTMYDMGKEKWKMRQGPVFCNLLLADEINRAPAKTQAALLEVMQEQQVTIDGVSYPLEQPFFTIATQNPIEQEGTYPLPEAQLDRFLLSIQVDYPSEKEELLLTKLVTEKKVGESLNVTPIEPVMELQRILQIQKIAAHLLVDNKIVEYAVQIVRATRSYNGIAVGAGPRGSIALLRTAKARALLAGNSFVTPDDVKKSAPAVLGHRIILSADMEIEGYSAQDVLADILKNTDAPRD